MENVENGSPKIIRHNPLTFYLRTLLYVFMALLVRAAALLPLGALFLFGAGSPGRWLALLCPLAIVFFVLPFRFSFAQALVQPAGEHRFLFDTAFGASGYADKLKQSLLHALRVFLWGIPLWLMLGYAYYAYVGIDMITLMSGLSDLGAGVTAVGAAVGNFFIGIFGGTQIVPNGGLMEGVYVVCAVMGAGLLVLLWGAMRNGAYRYLWALAVRTGRDPRAEARRSLRGRRWAQLGVAAINLALWAPALYVTFSTLKGVIGNLSDAVFNLIGGEQLDLPQMTGAIGPLLFAFFVCYMPLLPVRRILTAAFATAQPRPAETAPASAPVDTAAFAPEREPVAAYRPARRWSGAVPEYAPDRTEEPEQPPVGTAKADAVEAEQPEAYRQTEPFQTEQQADIEVTQKTTSEDEKVKQDETEK